MTNWQIMDEQQIAERLKATIRQLLPEILVNGTRLARVVAVHNQAGIGNLWQRRFYAVDLTVLDTEGDDDPEFETLYDVELPQGWGRASGGLFARPQVGAVMRIGFDYGDKDKPYIISGTSRGVVRVPGGESGEFLVAFSKRVYWLIDRLGNFFFKTSGKITEEAGAKESTISGEYTESSGERKTHAKSLLVEVDEDSTEEVLGAKTINAGAINLETEGDINALAGGKRSAIVTETDREVVGNTDGDATGKQIKVLIGDLVQEAVAGNVVIKAGLLIQISNQITDLLELSEITCDLIRDLMVVNWTGTSKTTPDVIAAAEMLKLQYQLLLKGG